MTDDERAALEAAVRAARDTTPPGTRLLAIGWSSVESARTERAMGGPFEDVSDDDYLGASCRITVGIVGVPVIVLEPCTEGRLAALLARHGEGPAVAWYASQGDVVPAGPVSDGPFGAEWPVRGDGVGPGPVVLVTARAATIAT